MIRPCTLLLGALVVIAFHVRNSPAQKAEGSADTGFFNHLLETGRSDIAGLEYERLLYEESGVSAGLSCKFGDSLLKAGDYDRAEYAFENALNAAGRDSHYYAAARFGIIRSYIMQRKPLLALNELAAFDTPSDSTADIDLISLYKSAAYAAAYSIDSSKRLLVSIARPSRCADKVLRLDSLITWYESSGMKDPFNAYVYSSAIPGWGHWRIGERTKATASFMLMAGLTGLLGYEGYRFCRGNKQQRYVYGMDIFLVGSLLWRRYYNSIRKAAYERSVEYNQRIQVEYQRKLREIIGQ
jgi:hypothetical protein